MKRFILLLSFFSLTLFSPIELYAQTSTSYEEHIDAAYNGDAKAQYEIALCYWYGKGVKKDLTQASEWLSKSIEQNYSEAQNFYGKCFLIGDGVKRNYEKAALYFQMASENNSPEAIYNLAACYHKGWGVNQNFQKAIELMKKASALNYPKAKEYLISMNIYQTESHSETITEASETRSQQNVSKQRASRPEYISKSPVDINIPNSNFSNETTFAVIIGNENYKNVEGVPYAKNDAYIFREYVNKTLGVPLEQIKYIENAGYNDMRIAINWLCQAMKIYEGRGRAIVYYAGHGIPSETGNSAYLLPVDGIGNDPLTAYGLKDLYEVLGKLESKSIMVFLDACFSGTKREDGMLTSARGVAIKVKPTTPKGNIIVFSAAQGDETAYPYKDMQHGMFTYYLLKKLQDTNGNISLGELSDYVKTSVKRQSFLKNNKVQTPMISVALPLQNRWKNLKLR